MLPRRQIPRWPFSDGILGRPHKQRRRPPTKLSLEYASTTWAPQTETDIRKLEMVQRRAARFVFIDYQRTSSVAEMIGKTRLADPTAAERLRQAHDDVPNRTQTS